VKNIRLNLTVPSDQAVWRYLDLAKYLHLLSTSTLYFPNAREFADLHEGALPESAARLLRDRLGAEEKGQKTIRSELDALFPELEGKMQPSPFIRDADTALAKLRAVLRVYGVSCWYMLNHESDAMWRLYAPSGNGVAVRSTVARLISSLRHTAPVNIHPITYLDFDADLPQIEEDTPDYFLLLLKRIVFVHEAEVRLVAERAPDSPEGRGFSVRCDLATLVDEVVVSPYAPEWLCSVLDEVTKRLSPGLLVRASVIGDPPQPVSPVDW
jgi:hypothetical protein